MSKYLVWGGIALGGLILLSATVSLIEGIVLKLRLARILAGGAKGKAAADKIVKGGSRNVQRLVARVAREDAALDAAFELLIRIGDPGGLTQLARLFGSPATVRAATLVGEAAVPFLDALRDSGDSPRRVAAVEALAAIGGTATWNALAAMAVCGDAEASRKAEDACVAIGEPIIPSFGPLIRKSLPGGGAAAAIRALERIGGSLARAAIIEAAGPSSRARKEAAEALGRSGGSDAVEPLIRMLPTYDDDASKAAVDALGKLGDPRALRPLREELRGHYPWRALNAIEQIGGEEAAEALAQEYRSAHKDEIAEALYRLDPQRAAQVVAVEAERGNIPAALTLARHADAGAYHHLVSALESASPQVRRDAATALVGLYRGNRLDDEAKRDLLQRRSAIEHRHIDYSSQHNDHILTYTPSDCSNLVKGDHEDIPSVHNDAGIGVKFED